MARIFVSFLGMIFFLLTGQAVGGSTDFPWVKIDEGFEFKSVQMSGEPYQSPIKMKILRISLEKFQVRVLDTRIFGAGRLEVRELARKAQALAAVNGGFFQPDYRPLGLIISDGKEVNPLRNADWGIFLVQGNLPRIIHTKEYLPNGNISQALQVGPRLVVNGRELQMKKQVARRSALGITRKDKLILLNTDDTDVYAQDLARAFTLPESEGGLECRDALTLDGGPSAQMYADFKSLKIDIPGKWGVPNGVAIFHRNP